MGNIAEACRALKETFQKAKVLGDKEAILSMALADADLEPLWAEIRTW